MKHDHIITTLFYYCTLYYCTILTENPCVKPTLLPIELLPGNTTFRAAIAAKILSCITTFHYNTTTNVTVVI